MSQHSSINKILVNVCNLGSFSKTAVCKNTSDVADRPVKKSRSPVLVLSTVVGHFSAKDYSEEILNSIVSVTNDAGTFSKIWTRLWWIEWQMTLHSPCHLNVLALNWWPCLEDWLGNVALLKEVYHWSLGFCGFKSHIPLQYTPSDSNLQFKSCALGCDSIHLPPPSSTRPSRTIFPLTL